MGEGEGNIHVRISLLILLFECERLSVGDTGSIRVFQSFEVREKKKIEIKKYETEQQKLDKDYQMPVC